MRVGLSGVHVRPGASGSHEPYFMELEAALANLAEGTEQFELVVFKGRDFANSAKTGSAGAPSYRIVRIPLVHRSRILRIVAEQLIVPCLKRFHRLDVMHYAGTAASLFSSSSDLVTFHHDSTTQRSSMGRVRNFYYGLLAKLASRTGAVVAPTESYATQLAAIYPALSETLVGVNHGTGPLFYEIGRQNLDVARTGHVLVVTNELPHKNLRGAILTFSALVDAGVSQARLLIVGRVSLEHLMALLDSERVSVGCRERIQLLGPLTHDEVARLHIGASAALFLSHVETFGMPVSEAMAAGVPIIASNIEVHREVGGSGAILVEPDDHQGAAKQLARLMNESDYAKAWVRRGRDRAADLDWTMCADRHFEIFCKLRRD